MFLKIPWVGTMTYGDEMFTTVRSTVLRWHRRGGHLGTIAGGAEHGTNIHRRHIARATAPASPLSIAPLVSPAHPLVPSPPPPPPLASPCPHALLPRPGYLSSARKFFLSALSLHGVPAPPPPPRPQWHLVCSASSCQPRHLLGSSAAGRPLKPAARRPRASRLAQSRPRRQATA